MDYAVWNTLHDGRIVAIEGTLPGDLTLTIEITYLCKQLPTNKDHLNICLRGCRLFEFESFGGARSDDLIAIAKFKPEVLSAEPKDDCIQVCCVDGMLSLAYSAVERRLAEGTVISQADLESAADRYWTDWEQRHRKTN